LDNRRFGGRTPLSAVLEASSELKRMNVPFSVRIVRELMVVVSVPYNRVMLDVPVMFGLMYNFEVVAKSIEELMGDVIGKKIIGEVKVEEVTSDTYYLYLEGEGVYNKMKVVANLSYIINEGEVEEIAKTLEEKVGDVKYIIEYHIDKIRIE